jgi:hypothetical protein
MNNADLLESRLSLLDVVDSWGCLQPAQGMQFHRIRTNLACRCGMSVLSKQSGTGCILLTMMDASWHVVQHTHPPLRNGQAAAAVCAEAGLVWRAPDLPTSYPALLTPASA